jgi:hypothetical protein
LRVLESLSLSTSSTNLYILTSQYYRRRLFNKAVPQKLAPGVNFTSSDGVPATNPPDTTPLVSSDSAVLDYRTNSGPIKINNNNNTTKSQPWLNPLSTNSPNNTNGTLPAGTSPSTPSLLTAGTVLAVASSSNTNGSKVNGSSPNSTLRKKKGTPIKTGWLRLNNTIRWFELMKYKMVYYASNNEVRSDRIQIQLQCQTNLYYY